MQDEMNIAVLGVAEVDFSSELPRADRFRGYLVNGYQEQSTKIKSRKLELRDEVRRLYNAASFLPWETGLFLNALLTINAASLGFQDWVAFSVKITEFNKEMNRCLYDGDGVGFKKVNSRGSIQRVSQRSLEVVPHPHYWMSVLEYGREKGGHSHQLCVVPKTAAKAFKLKTLDWWTKHSPGPVQPEAIDFRIEHPTDLRRKASLQRELFRYVIKTTSATWGIPLRSGDFLWFRQIFKPYPNDSPVVCAAVSQIAQITHRLNAKAQNATEFASHFSIGRYDEVYDAWEREPYNRQEKMRQRAFLSSLKI